MVSLLSPKTRPARPGFGGTAKTRAKLMVVDDSDAVRDAVRLALHYGGYETCSASGGNHARELIAQEVPALLITDLDMPEGNGWGLIAFCQARHPELPVLIVSGSAAGTQPDIERHAQGFLPKPFGFRELLAEVERLLPKPAERPRASSGHMPAVSSP